MLLKNTLPAWAFAAFMLAGCGHHNGNNHNHEGHDHDHDHDHAHELVEQPKHEEKADDHEAHKHEGHNHGHADEHYAVTAYDADLEFYAEMPALIIGHEGALNVHLTRLADFKPEKDAKMTIVLNVNGKNIPAEKVEAEGDGIYKVHIEPTAAGKAKLEANVETAGKKHSFIIDSLLVAANHEEAHEDLESREADVPNAVALTKKMTWNVEFSTQPVQVITIGQVIKTVAEIQPSQGDEQIIVASADGVVSFLGNTLVEGKQVTAGQKVCNIDASATVNNNLSAQQQQAATELQRAKNEYERLSKLSVDKLVLESEVQAAKATYEQAQQNYNTLHKNGSGKSVTVSASRSGYVKQVMVANGQYVTAGTPVAVVSQSKSLRLKANVRSRYFSQLRNICGANIRLIDHTANNGVWTLDQLHGRVLSYGRQADANATMVPVFFEVDNVADFLPGTFVEMFIETCSKQPKTVVPVESVLEEMGNYFVFVQVTPELFEKRQVLIGETDGINTEVKSGVKAGERVVAKGAMLVKMQQAAGAVDPHSGHSH